MTRPTVDDERLGALLDRRLGEPERAELLAHVAASDEESAVLAEAAAVLREMEGTGEDEAAGEVVLLRPSGRRTGLPRGGWLALAAVLAGLALVPLLWQRLRPVGIPQPQRAVALLDDQEAGLPGTLDLSPWSGTRGGPGDPLTDEARAVRFGARLVDLELAARTRDTLMALLAGEMRMLATGDPDGSATARIYGELAARAGEAPERLAPRLEEGREAVAAIVAENAELLALGAWLEAARIAAHRGDVAFFRTRESQAALAAVAARMGTNDPPARAAVERIRTAARAGALNPGVTSALAQLLRRLAG